MRNKVKTLQHNIGLLNAGWLAILAKNIATWWKKYCNTDRNTFCNTPLSDPLNKLWFLLLWTNFQNVGLTTD